MKRFWRAFILLTLSGIACLTSYGQSRAIVDFDADRAIPVLSGDSTVTALVGHVIFHHNGAMLTCDSAVRYSADYIECFKNVLINKDSTYIYGDRVDFNGITNIAKVYAPIVKTIDGDMTMYSYDMEFNTLTKIGRFTQGGTIAQKDNLMEAVEAIYHADERDIFFVREVVMRNEEYIIRTDSMGYNFDTEVTTFYRPAKIWNSGGDFLSADYGNYDRINDTYTFTRNSYILTEDQEVFADSITYMKTAGRAYMFNNIQIHDQAQLAFLFGDYGVYWTEDQQAIVTDNPSAIGYEEAENPDSVYMRGDTIFMHTIASEIEFTPEVAARLRLPGRAELASLQQQMQDSMLVIRPDSLLPDSLSHWGHLYGEGADTMLLQKGMRGEWADSLPPPGLPGDSLSLDSLPSDLAAERADSLRGLYGPDPLAADTTSTGVPVGMVPAGPVTGDDRYPLITDPPLPDTLGKEGIQLPEEPVAEQAARPKTKRQIRQEQRLERRRQRMRDYAEEQGLIVTDSLPAVDSLPPVDSLPEVVADTLPQDSLQRILRSYRNVKIFRHDMQAVCDSLVAFSIDSTAYMYISPVLWSEQSQITAEEVHIFSRNEQLERADFIGDPLIAQWVLDSLFNQIAGDKMEAYFLNNEIVRMEVLGNAQSYYYMQEDDKPDDVGGFLDQKSQDMTIRFDSMRVQQIIGRVNPVYSVFPMDKIPPEQPQRFNHFEWMEHLRPRNHFEVCDRIIRLSQREESRSIPYPDFPITRVMEENKKRFIEQGIWRDRNDILSVDPSYFRNQPF